MVFHHFFGFDDFRNPQNYYIESFNIHGISFERMLAAFGKICVSIFAFFSGYALYKWRIFDRLSAKYADIPCLAVILVLIAIPIMRQSLILVNPGLISAAEVIITPLFIFFSILFIRRLDNGMNKILRYRATLVTDMLCALGMMSMNIWFLHGIFFTGRRPLQDLVYSPHYPVLIYAFAFLLLIPAARAVALLQKRIHTLQYKKGGRPE